MKDHVRILSIPCKHIANKVDINYLKLFSNNFIIMEKYFMIWLVMQYHTYKDKQ